MSLWHQEKNVKTWCWYCELDVISQFFIGTTRTRWAPKLKTKQSKTKIVDKKS